MQPYVMKADIIGSEALDFSYLLDAPAGKNGFVIVNDGHFYFKNGKRINFFGVNLVFGAAMPDKEIADKIADRLAASGVNMVRLHHIDSYSSDSSIIDYSNNNSQKLHEDNMDRLDYLTAKLKKRGIYLHIDLFTLRKFLPGDDLDYPDETGGAIKNIQYYNQRLIELHKKFIKQYLHHYNPYTESRYVDDPFVAVVQILNENSVFWENAENEFPSYRKELDRKWNRWLLEKYKNRKNLAEQWTDENGTCGLMQDEDPGKNTVKRPEPGIWGERTLNYNADYDSLDGPARHSDWVEFLTEIQINYIQEMTEYLRDLGVKCPINASNLPGGAAELNCLTYADVVEKNGYWNHPENGFRVPVEFHQEEMSSTDPRDRTVSHWASNLISRLATGRVKNKPFMVTEWNACYPTKFRSDVILMLASYASMQDWDGLLLFSYSHHAGKEFFEQDKMSGFFNSFNDPGIWGLVGICSALFQNKHVKNAENLVEVNYTPEDCRASSDKWNIPYQTIPFISRIAADFLHEEKYNGDADLVLSSGFTPTGDYTNARHSFIYARTPYIDGYQKRKGKDGFLEKHSYKPDRELRLENDIIGELSEKSCVISAESVIDQDPQAFTKIFDKCIKRWGLIRENQGYQKPGCFISDTEQLEFDFAAGIFKLDTDNIVGFAGKPGKITQIDNYKFVIDNKKAAVTLFSRDGNKLKNAKSILITAVGESVNKGMVWEGNTLINEGEGPVMIDQITGIITIPATYQECKAYALDQTGTRVESVKLEKNKNEFIIYLEGKTTTIYYELVLN